MDGLVRDLANFCTDGQIIAWCDIHVVLWKYQTTKSGKWWTVQSILQSSDPITALDYKEGV